MYQNGWLYVLNFAVVALPAFLLYWFGLRPILKQTPRFRVFYDEEGRFLLALADKLQGIKQRVMTVVVAIVGTVLLMWDNVAPFLTGVDMGQILPQIPSWAWPLITAALLYLAQHFRDLADKRAQEEIDELVMSPPLVVVEPEPVAPPIQPEA